VGQNGGSCSLTSYAVCSFPGASPVVNTLLNLLRSGFGMVSPTGGAVAGWPVPVDCVSAGAVDLLAEALTDQVTMSLPGLTRWNGSGHTHGASQPISAVPCGTPRTKR